MAFCMQCGKEIAEGSMFCGNCGARLDGNAQNSYTQQPQSQQVQQNNDKDLPSIGFNILSFILPIIGLLLFIIWRNDYPRKAKSCGVAALIGFIIRVFLFIINEL